MYIIYNQDGSIKKVKLTDFINQGSDGVNKIYVAIDGVSQSDYTVTVKWLLPNGEYVGPLVANPASETIKDDDGESYDNAYEISIDAEETLYHGILKGSIVAERLDSTRLYTYPAKLVVNPTTYEPSSDINISEVAYDNLLNYIKTRTCNQEYVDTELAKKADKVGNLPFYGKIYNNTNIYTFLTTVVGSENSIKPLILYHDNGRYYIGRFGNTGAGYNIELENLSGPERYYATNININNMTFGDFMSSTYRKNFALQEDLDALETEVDNEVQEIREIAEGKNKAFVLDGTNSIIHLKSEVMYASYKVYQLTQKNTFTDITSGIRKGDYDNTNFVNSLLKRNTPRVDLPHANPATDYLIFNGCSYFETLGLTGNYYVVADLYYLSTYLDIKTGDALYLTDSDAPNRWFSSSYILYRLGDRKIIPNSIVISATRTFAEVKAALNSGETSTKHAYLYNAWTLLSDQEPTEITEEIKQGDYNDAVVRNSLFYSNNTTVTLTAGVSYPQSSYLIVEESSDVFWIIRMTQTNPISFLPRGSNVWITQNGIPDRWAMSGKDFVAIEGN